MQSLHDFCYEETTAHPMEQRWNNDLIEHHPPTKSHVSLLFASVTTSAKLALEIVTMLSIFATGAVLTVISAPVLFFL